MIKAIERLRNTQTIVKLDTVLNKGYVVLYKSIETFGGKKKMHTVEVFNSEGRTIEKLSFFYIPKLEDAKVFYSYSLNVLMGGTYVRK